MQFDSIERVRVGARRVRAEPGHDRDDRDQGTWDHHGALLVEAPEASSGGGGESSPEGTGVTAVLGNSEPAIRLAVAAYASSRWMHPGGDT